MLSALSRSNDVEFGRRFVKWRDMNPKCAKIMEYELNPDRMTCPVAVQEDKSFLKKSSLLFIISRIFVFPF